MKKTQPTGTHIKFTEMRKTTLKYTKVTKTEE